MNIVVLSQHLQDLYGKINSVRFTSITRRIGYLTHATRLVQISLRTPDETDEKFGRRLAHVVGWVFCVGNHFPNFGAILAWAMEAKYGGNACAYCRKLPCGCPKVKDQVPKYVYSPELVRGDSLAEFQDRLALLYASKNNAQGPDYIVARLMGEVAEVFSLITAPNPEWDVDQYVREWSLELADVLAWTMAMATNRGIDLQAAVFQAYGQQVCTGCGGMPCRCGNFAIRPVNYPARS